MLLASHDESLISRLFVPVFTNLLLSTLLPFGKPYIVWEKKDVIVIKPKWSLPNWCVSIYNVKFGMVTDRQKIKYIVMYAFGYNTITVDET